MKNKINHPPLQINSGSFVDGSWFQKIAEYFKHEHTVNAFPSILEIKEWTRSDLAKKTGTVTESVIFKKAVSFNGILPPDYLCKDLKKAIPSIIRNHALVEAGFELSLLPVERGSNGFLQKGVDVELALTVYEKAVSENLDIVVLFAGDADFVPLLRRLERAGIRTLLVTHPKMTSKSLIRAATWTIELKRAIESDDELRIKIFGEPLQIAA